MVNFDYGLQIFADDVMRIYMNCFTIFILHNEDPLSQTKDVMFGHINANSNIYTDENFYKTLPSQVRQAKLGKADADIPAHKHKLAFEMIMDPHSKTQKISISMRRLKFFMRPTVFKEISEFTIECLKKLDLKRELELSQAK